jgi:hypothetical protein
VSHNVGRGRPQGSVYGFDVCSTLAFDMLRTAVGGIPLEVVPQDTEASACHELVVEVDEPDFLARMYHDGATYRLWVDGVGWFDIDPRVPRIAVPPAAAALEREEVLWGVPVLLCFLHRGDWSLHAAAVEIDGEAILLVAPQAHGKSTLAAAFARRGFRLLSEDLTCVRLEPRPAVVPGPAGLRLRNDVAAHVEGDFGRPLGRRHERTRYALRNRGDCRAVPIRAVLLLRQSEQEIRLQPVEPVRSLPDLWQSSFRLTKAHERRCFECVATLARAVPIMNLYRPLDIESLDPTVDQVLSQLAGAPGTKS